jgi:hypothetical protein
MLVFYALEDHSPSFILALSRMLVGIHVWVSTGRMAVWSDRGNLDRGGSPQMVEKVTLSTTNGR